MSKTINELIGDFKKASDSRFDSFEIENAINNLSKIQDDAYLENSKWLGGDEKFICIAIDLDSSSALSIKKDPRTMARLYEYFTKNIVDILNYGNISADYIDIKGDGVFGIYQDPKAIEKSFVAAITFRTLFDKIIKKKFKDEFNVGLTCKSAIYKDKLLVKKIGNRKYKNEVWAGRLVNNTYKIMSTSDRIKEKYPQKNNDSLLIISDEIKTYLTDNYYDSAILSCGCGDNGQQTNLWGEFDVSENEEIVGNKVHYLSSIWCDVHGDDYLSAILD